MPEGERDTDGHESDCHSDCHSPQEDENDDLNTSIEITHVDERVIDTGPSDEGDIDENHPFFVSLSKYLQSRHGKSRTPAEAKAISSEVMKYFRFCGPVLDTTNLYNPIKLEGYLRSLEAEKKATTQYSIVCRLRQGIRYVQLGLDTSETVKADKCLLFVANWISAIGKEARQAKRINLEEMADRGAAPMGGIDDFCKSEEMVKSLDLMVQKANGGKKLASRNIQCAAVWLAGCLLHTNAQRPGAICNATVTEYEKAVVTTAGREKYTTFYVRHHKTASTGRAKITMNKHIATQMKKYVDFIRPQTEGSSSNVLFPNRDGKPLAHLSRRANSLAKVLGTDLPSTATKTRHSAATAVQEMPEEERSAVANTMSHSQRTQQLYYSLKKGRKEAVEGFQAMEEMRRKPSVTCGRKRKLFTPEETNTIRSYFTDNISAGATPGLEECREFVTEHAFPKDPKQVRDKVRNLIGR